MDKKRIEKMGKYFNNALDIERDILSEIANNIKDELNSKLKNQNYNFTIDVRYGNIEKFRDYVWLHIKDENNQKCYLITLFFNDINDKSSNPRTQFGRIQFWKDVIEPDEEDKEIPSPHIHVKDNGDILLEFAKSKSYDPEQVIYDGTYDVSKLINDFIDFI